VPAMYNIIEAYAQLKNQAGVRQVENARRAWFIETAEFFLKVFAILGA
jgi:hypothetical protein